MNNSNKKYLENKTYFPVPKHIVIIPDGNRRWAKNKGFISLKGHEKAVEKSRLEGFIKIAKDIGVKYFSLWGFSTENWKRNEKEKENLFRLFFKVVDELYEIVHKEKIKFRHLGRKDRLPKNLVNKIISLEKETYDYNEFNVNLCLDYGGRDEIIRAVNDVLKSGKTEIDEKYFSEFLDTKNIPDPDMIVRTSGEKRLSGIMPFQGVYAELFFVDKHFPDFNEDDLYNLINNFGKRKRRFGGG